MITIAVIGAGQLGSRHLQALSRMSIPVQIEVVDPEPVSLKTAKARFEEMPSNQDVVRINYFSSLHELSKKIDLAIIATSSDIRADVVRKLIELCDVRYFILEKVLFQRPEEYGEIKILLGKKGIGTWVNHPRRAFPYYQKLKELLNGSHQISYQVQGGDWGLACNSLHMIDHLAFLTGEDSLEVSTERLNRLIIPSKRKGFIEFTGTLAGQIGPHPFEFFCHNEVSPVIITICSDNLNVIIDEANGWIRMAKKVCGWKWEEEKEKIIYFQSELSDKIAGDIISSGRCDLPTYEQAMNLHLPLINSLIEYLSLLDQKKYDYCPIT